MSKKKDNEVEKFAQDLQDQILEQARRVYGEVVIDHWQKPRNFRSLDRPDGYARLTGVCGDTMEMFLRIKDDIITDCTFRTDGCGTTIACGSVATELATQKSFLQALGTVNAEAILKILEGLPESDMHCAQLAAEALRLALADGLSKKRSPWKKDYEKPR